MKTLLLCCLSLPLTLYAQDAFRVTVTGQGQPMILIPGLASSGEVWDSTVARYGKTYQCHVLTMAGFVGVPRIPAPILDKTRDAVAAYIREKQLTKPIIVGHSLGGFLALALASKFPELPGKLIIVDSYPFLSGIMDPGATPEKAEASATQMKKIMAEQSQDMYERYVKSGMSTRAMVTKDSDLDRVIAWSLASDRGAVTDAYSELLAGDLRQDIAKIKVPVLVMTAWIGYKQYTDRERTEANVRRQYEKLAGADIRITDTARHLIMWDDPEWMFAQIDDFVAGDGKSRRP